MSFAADWPVHIGEEIRALEEQIFTGLDEEPTLDKKIQSSRVRTGFIESVLAFELNKELSETTSVKARVALDQLLEEAPRNACGKRSARSGNQHPRIAELTIKI